MTSSFARKIIVATFSVLTLTSVASANNFIKTPNAGIPGYNQETHSGISLQSCFKLCTDRGWCKSADYERAKGKCFLQPVSKHQQSLRTDYPGNPYDHYHKKEVLADGTYRLTTQWQGQGRSLDIVNDDRDRTPILADTGNFSGQMWNIKRQSNGFYRLTTEWQGEGMSLDVINDGTNNRLQLAPTGNFSGQDWKLTPQGDGFYRLTTMWRGEGMSLDIVNDGTNRTPILARTGDFSGQYWKLTPIR